jgi:hypothetical protein
VPADYTVTASETRRFQVDLPKKENGQQ